MNAAARIALLVVIALAVALTANFVLLGIANGPKDPVGQLNPRAGVVRIPLPATTTTQAPGPTRTAPAPVPAPPRRGVGGGTARQDD